MLLMGWDGTEVVSAGHAPAPPRPLPLPCYLKLNHPQTPQIRSLIEDHHLGSIILTAKNLKCKEAPFVERLLICLVR